MSAITDLLSILRYTKTKAKVYEDLIDKVASYEEVKKIKRDAIMSAKKYTELAEYAQNRIIEIEEKKK
jgi:hypothetical protein